MTLGQKLKSIRQQRNESQPDFAQRLGIEQSYLSKLENDKSVPSSEVFNGILLALNLSREQFLNDPALAEDLPRLRQIPEVDNWLQSEQHKGLARTRRWLYLCSGLIVLGVSLFYLATQKGVFPETLYVYQSLGVIEPDEPRNIYTDWRQMQTGMEHDEFRQKAAEMARRRNVEWIESYTDMGPQFEISVKNGYRFYRLDKTEQQPRAINAWLQVLAVGLFIAGLMGFLLERKFRR